MSLDQKEILDLLVCLGTRDPMGSRETLACRDLRDRGDTEDPPDHLDRLESQDLQGPEGLRERWETQVLLVSREMLESLVVGARGDQLVNPVILGLRVCLVWRADLDLLDLLDPLDLLVIPFLSPPRLSLVEKQPQVFPALQDQWEPLDLQERGEPMVSGDQVEGEESPAWLDLLELPEDRDYLEDLAILETLESLDDLEDHFPRTIFERFVPLS